MAADDFHSKHADALAPLFSLYAQLSIHLRQPLRTLTRSAACFMRGSPHNRLVLLVKAWLTYQLVSGCHLMLVTEADGMSYEPQSGGPHNGQRHWDLCPAVITLPSLTGCQSKCWQILYPCMSQQLWFCETGCSCG